MARAILPVLLARPLALSASHVADEIGAPNPVTRGAQQVKGQATTNGSTRRTKLSLDTILTVKVLGPAAAPGPDSCCNCTPNCSGLTLSQR